MTHKGKYYHCIFNIAEKRVMIVGGRPGTARDFWDDKTFVYQWEGSDFTAGGRYVGTDQQKMESSPESCRGADESAGCVRPNEWPDLPSTSILACQGQCRNGQPGQGPTNPRWIEAYCFTSASFWNGKEFEEQTFNLCEHTIGG